MRQETLTVVARVVGAPPFAELRAALRLIAEDRAPGGGARPRIFAHAELGIHFARLVLLEEPSEGTLASSLIFESNFDTAFEDEHVARFEHLKSLCGTIYEPLSSVFRHCEGFAPSASENEFALSLAGFQVQSSAAYQGHIERDLSRIRLERHLREVLIDFFSQAPKAPLRQLYHAAREHVRLRCATDPGLAGLDLDQPPPPLPDAVARSRGLRAGIVPWVKNLSSDLIAYVLSQLCNIRRWQREDPEYDQRARQEAWTAADRRTFVELAETEDHALQNALTHIVPLKGVERLALLLFSHGYIDTMARQHFDQIGQLGGIPTIHFAKWLLIDDNARLLFFSNYDSSWESYLGDFVDRAAIGLNLAWTLTKDYPTTRYLTRLGARDEERFKAWSRAYQRPTQVFYTAYPELGIAALNNNTWIRCGLHHPPGAAELRSWFRRLT
ncbi:MAG TPA: hypothetical protein VER96_12525 [Polyangiaceae bacterium]|nr:hypothetical protein [Polyangiaceae bacterium]